jgi:hypothetical protein
MDSQSGERRRWSSRLAEGVIPARCRGVRRRSCMGNGRPSKRLRLTQDGGADVRDRVRLLNDRNMQPLGEVCLFDGHGGAICFIDYSISNGEVCPCIYTPVSDGTSTLHSPLR